VRGEPWSATATIVALTGWGHVEARERVREAGFDAYLVKPVDDQALERRLLAGAPSGAAALRSSASA
jgi:two-component system CheB/CheR fusion protein